MHRNTKPSFKFLLLIISIFHMIKLGHTFITKQVFNALPLPYCTPTHITFHPIPDTINYPTPRDSLHQTSSSSVVIVLSICVLCSFSRKVGYTLHSWWRVNICRYVVGLSDGLYIWGGWGGAFYRKHFSLGSTLNGLWYLANKALLPKSQPSTQRLRARLCCSPNHTTVRRKMIDDRCIMVGFIVEKFVE